MCLEIRLCHSTCKSLCYSLSYYYQLILLFLLSFLIIAVQLTHIYSKFWQHNVLFWNAIGYFNNFNIFLQNHCFSTVFSLPVSICFLSFEKQFIVKVTTSNRAGSIQLIFSLFKHFIFSIIHMCYYRIAVGNFK